jgi:putative copper export protein/methionine-rich copper-binding protein CopC
MHRIRLVGAAAGVSLAMLLGFVGPALGHALLVLSDPVAGASLATAPSEVTLTFTEQPDPALSTIKVLATDGTSVGAGPVSAVPGQPKELRVALGKLQPGVYTVSWRTLSSVDGHLASGSFAFGVGVSAPSVAPSQAGGSGVGGSSIPTPAEISGRWLLYLGLIGLFGAAFVSLVVFRMPPPLIPRVLAVAWLTATAGTLILVATQLGESSVGVGAFLSSSAGGHAELRAVSLLAAGLAVVAAWLARGNRLALGAVGVAAAGGMLADVATSHAAAGGNPWLDVGVQWLHVVATGFWLGGLVALLLTLRGPANTDTGRVARRYAWVAGTGIAVVSATGFLRGLSEVGSIGALFSTDFGLVVIAKSALLGVIGSLGAFNHFFSVPAAGRSLGLLRRVGSVEVLVGATVVLLSATLVNLAPPTSAVAAPPAPVPEFLVAQGNDFGTSVRVRLTITPGTAGFNTFSASLADYDSGAPLDGRTVSLRFELPARPDVGSSRLALDPKGSGQYEATGGNLSLDGKWRLTVVVAADSGAVEIPLELTTRTLKQVVDVNRTPGLPTIYTVHLAGGATVQVYLDPGKVGPNELHVTFFDAKGAELPVPSAAVSLGRAGEAPAPLDPRELEPGHFAADTSVSAAGTYAVSLSGTPPGGQALVANFQIEVTP